MIAIEKVKLRIVDWKEEAIDIVKLRCTRWRKNLSIVNHFDIASVVNENAIFGKIST